MTLVTIHRDDVAYSLWTGRLSPRGTSPRVGRNVVQVDQLAGSDSRWNHGDVSVPDATEPRGRQMKFIAINRNDTGIPAMIGIAPVRVGLDWGAVKDSEVAALNKGVKWWQLAAAFIGYAFVSGFVDGFQRSKVDRNVYDRLDLLSGRASNLNDRINEVEDRLPALPSTRNRGDS